MKTQSLRSLRLTTGHAVLASLLIAGVTACGTQDLAGVVSGESRSGASSEASAEEFDLSKKPDQTGNSKVDTKPENPNDPRPRPTNRGFQGFTVVCLNGFVATSQSCELLADLKAHAAKICEGRKNKAGQDGVAKFSWNAPCSF